MANDAVTKLVLASIKKGLIKNEKDLTVTSHVLSDTKISKQRRIVFILYLVIFSLR